MIMQIDLELQRIIGRYEPSVSPALKRFPLVHPTLLKVQPAEPPTV